MRKIVLFSFLLSVICILAFPGDLSPLSQKAANLKMGMSRAQVIKLLGPAQWVVLPTDKGDWEFLDATTGLELYWDNPGNSNVIVMFDLSLNVIGWDEGRLKMKPEDENVLDPPSDYSCEKEDRSEYCH